MLSVHSGPVHPCLHTHEYASTRSSHCSVPAVLHGLLSQSLTTSPQISPPQPVAVQLQANSFRLLRQTPPFAQGRLAHSSTSDSQSTPVQPVLVQLHWREPRPRMQLWSDVLRVEGCASNL